MSNSRHIRSRQVVTGVALIAAVVLPLTSVVAQVRPTTAKAQRTQRAYKVPRTADGQPDLQGYWTNLTYTPFERPKELGNKAFYTEQEALDAFNRAAQMSLTTDQLVHYVQSDFASTPVQGGARPNLRTSLVIDPPDGRIPAFTREAEQRLEAQRAAQAAKDPIPQTWRDDRGANWCVFHEGVVPLIPDQVGYGSNYHIVQSRDWVTIIYEWNGERRIIPLDGRPHGPASVRTYAGDSRGRWEGDTLVIDTINFKRSPNERRFRGAGETLKLVERLTRTSDDTIDYTFTVDDLSTWTTPWTAAVPMQRIKGPMLEYACNENNVDVFSNLRNARAQEEGKLPPPTAMRRGDAKAVVIEREEKGEAEIVGDGGK